MNKMEDDKPWVSVVIPCFNDAQSIGLVLEALNQQTYPRERTEILVVDNGSEDGSLQIAERYADQVLSEPIRSSYVARNRGIKIARGQYLLFLDADTVPYPRWIAEMVDVSEKSGSPLVGGRIENKVTRFTLGSILLSLTRSADHRREAVEKYGCLSGGNMLVRRETFDRYGFFLTVRSGGDNELGKRANPEGKPIPYAAEAIVTHLCDISSVDYLKRAFRIARGQTVTLSHPTDAAPKFPWRPGIRRATELCHRIRQEIGPRAGKFIYLRIFLLLWLERLLFYFGCLSGKFSL